MTQSDLPVGSRDMLRELAEREMCRRRLLPFVMRMYPQYLAGWVHKELCAHLEQFLDDVVNQRSPRLMIFMPPRVGKSFLASEMFPEWSLGKYPWLEYVATSYSSTLVEGFSRIARRAIREDERYKSVFPGLLLDDETQAVNRWQLRVPDDVGSSRIAGGYRAVGVGGGLTGFGAHILAIDDPVANAESANSEVIRDSTWNWYATTARTRVMPGGGVLIIQCMTGDTPVLMADGSEKRLDEVRPGDLVGSYKNGRLVSRAVLNWQSSGLDNTLAIKTTCGKVVRANGRHPFLVLTSAGETRWIRAQDLRAGDSLVRLRDARAPERQKRNLASVARAARGPVTIGANPMPGASHPATGGSTAGSNARTRIAQIRRITGARAGTALRATGRITGRVQGGRTRALATEKSRTGTGTSSIGTASRSPSTTAWWRRKADVVLCAENYRTKPTLAHTGVESSASITVTTLTACERSCVTTVTSQPVMPKHLRSPEPWPNTSTFIPVTIESITPDGVDEVFDVEIEETENFIANSLVSSNTRWHDDDLSGRIIEMMKRDPNADQFRVISYPAIAEFDEPHRKAGEALHPERYDERAYAQIRATVGPVVWNALYQQNPVPDEGEYFKRDDLQYYTTPPPLAGLTIFAAWDLAISKRDSADPSCGVVIGITCEYDVYVLDRYYGRFDAEEIVQRLVECQKKWSPQVHIMEKEKVQMALGPFIEFAMQRERINSFVIEPIPPGKRDKEARARPLQGLVRRRKVYFPVAAEWTPSITAEMLRFPKGKHDDQVDALAYAVLNIDTMSVPPSSGGEKQPASWRDSLWKYMRGPKTTGHMAS